MKKTITPKEARAWAGALRLELLKQKRATGDPRAPMRARPGQEAAFEKAEADIAAADFILKLLETEERRERARALYAMKRKAVKTADALLDTRGPTGYLPPRFCRPLLRLSSREGPHPGRAERAA